ncbi:unnamed protein product [Chironomus riparius]|uniref:Uncharacterized protein n=1 Tax=Chironomus riparius TaxID=315576 RepID=A0A9N9S168_9DIPT|nr:unnamed protein product [Chironomus riparius]
MELQMQNVRPRDGRIQYDGNILIGLNTEMSADYKADRILLRIGPENDLDPSRILVDFHEGNNVTHNFSIHVDAATARLIEGMGRRITLFKNVVNLILRE